VICKEARLTPCEISEGLQWIVGFQNRHFHNVFWNPTAYGYFVGFKNKCGFSLESLQSFSLNSFFVEMNHSFDIISHVT